MENNLTRVTLPLIFQAEAQAWWAVDIDVEVFVTGVIVKNRADCCADRLDGITILLNAGSSLDDNLDDLTAKVRTCVLVDF